MLKKIRQFFMQHLTAFIAVGVLLGMIFLTTISVRQTVKSLEEIARARFDTKTDRLIAKVDNHYDALATTIRSIRGFFAGSDFVTRKEFYEFIETSQIRQAYPGFSTIAFIQVLKQENLSEFLEDTRRDDSVRPGGYPDFFIRPAGIRDEYWPILFIDPENESSVLLGSDQKIEETRRVNLERARDTGDISVSSVINLLPRNKPGVVIAAPLYQPIRLPPTESQRKAMFVGAVTTALYVDDFFQQSSILAGTASDNMRMSLSESSKKDSPIFIYENRNTPTKIARLFFTALQSEKEWDFNNKTWVFQFESNPAGQLTELEILEPLIVLLFFVILTLIILFSIYLVGKLRKLNLLRNRYIFISSLSHQIRTPLTVVLWGLEELIDSKKISIKKLKVLHKQVTGTNNLLNRLLLYIEITDSYQPRTKELVSIDQLYRDVARNLKNSHDWRRVVRTGITTKKDLIEGDTKKLVQAISYIVDNALTYSPKDSKVTVDLQILKKHAVITVTDTGYGIPVNERGQLFSGFFRASTASLGKNSGSGVSLHIAKTIFEAHGGTIGYRPNQPTGSIFIIKLPLKNLGIL